jgi:hypothetical protein
LRRRAHLVDLRVAGQTQFTRPELPNSPRWLADNSDTNILRALPRNVVHATCPAQFIPLLLHGRNSRTAWDPQVLVIKLQIAILIIGKYIFLCK